MQKEVKLYIEVDDKIRALNKAAKDYRKQKEDLSKSILETMKQVKSLKSSSPFLVGKNF